MRKITTESVIAFLTSTNFNRANMDVAINAGPNCDETHLYLHGNLIARKYIVPGGFGVEDSARIEIRDAGWRSNTTKERLNGLLQSFAPGFGVWQKDHAWYIGNTGNTWDWAGRAVFALDGELIEICDS